MTHPTNNGLLVVISGPSGVGKSSIAHGVEQRLGAVFSVSMTTRPQSPKERPGIDYHFVDEPRFHRAIEEGELLEHAEVFGHHYGTPIGPVRDAVAEGNIVVLEIDIAGAIQVHDRMPEAFMLFIMPPSKDEILRRLRTRNREGEEAIQRRFGQMEREVQRARDCGVYDEFLVNDDLEQTIRRAIELVEARRAQSK